MKNLIIVFVILLFLSSCDYPTDMVYEGKQNLIVYKMERCDNNKYGTYKYAITDATGGDWTLYSFSEFSVGDTIRITNQKVGN